MIPRTRSRRMSSQERNVGKSCLITKTATWDEQGAVSGPYSSFGHREFTRSITGCQAFNPFFGGNLRILLDNGGLGLIRSLAMNRATQRKDIAKTPAGPCTVQGGFSFGLKGAGRFHSRSLEGLRNG
jgi:hypothetical protein